MNRFPGRRPRSGGVLRPLSVLLPVLVLGPVAACGPGPEGTQRTFASPQEAADSLVAAAERFDVEALKSIVGPQGTDLVVTEDPVLDRNQATEFAAQARQRMQVLVDSTDARVASLSVGPGEWPVPIPLVEKAGRWSFDAAAGREEVLLRRIGRNELDAIEACRGYVEAQHEYASERRDGSTINQYAQRILSTPGRQDGLAWQAADGSWQGPVGERFARVVAEGYSERYEPFHGYYFKILKGQGPAAPMGELDFLVKDVMIGGFALVAAPAEYEVTGVMTFIVSHDGIVYQQDLGPETLVRFRERERYDPGPGWSVVEAD